MAEKKQSSRRRRKFDRQSAERMRGRLSLLWRYIRRLLLLILVLAGGGSTIAIFLCQKADRKAELLQSALTTGDAEKISLLKQESDFLPYRLFNPRLKECLLQATQWEERQGKALDLLQRRTEEVRRGSRTVASLSSEEMAEVERARLVPHPSIRKLSEEWQELCQKEAARLEMRKQEEIRRLEGEMPPKPELCQEPAEDARLLRQYQSQLEALEKQWLDARDAYHLPENSLLPLRERLAHARRLLKDAETMRSLLADLPSICSYGAYLERMKQASASIYLPSLQGARLLRPLPDEEELLHLIQAERLGIPVEKLASFRATHTQGKPTFSPSCPATQGQVHLMERVFAAYSAQKELTEWVNDRGEHCWTDEPPQREGNMLHLTRSDLDPKYSMSRSPSLRWEATGCRRLRTIRVAALLKSCRLRRETFFRELNLMSALESVLRYDRDDCPALARAWIYDTLLKVMQKHPQPEMMGLPYSPSLQADLSSFRRLREQCRVRLESGCWLAATPQVKHAEEAFNEWFRHRRYRNYTGETSRRVERLLRVYPLYVGYVDLQGKPVFCRTFSPDRLLWYLSGGTLTQTPSTSPLQHPAPLSPLFLCETSF